MKFGPELQKKTFENILNSFQDSLKEIKNIKDLFILATEEKDDETLQDCNLKIEQILKETKQTEQTKLKTNKVLQVNCRNILYAVDSCSWKEGVVHNVMKMLGGSGGPGGTSEGGRRRPQDFFHDQSSPMNHFDRAFGRSDTRLPHMSKY